MLDVLILRLREEIAIDGNSGSSIDTVWNYVKSISKEIGEESGASIVPLVDDRYKSFIWNYLKVAKDLEFYENIAPTVQENRNPNNTDVTMAEAADPTLELIDLIIPKHKINPSSSKKKAPAPKKTAKPKSKPKKKKAPQKKVTVGYSDDDFDKGDFAGNISNSDDSEFEDNDDESEIEQEGECEEYASGEEAPTKKKSPVPRQPKHANTTKPSDRKQVKTTLNRIDHVSNLNYEQMVEKYGSRLYITGTLELQEQQLYTNVPPGAALSSNLAIVLQEIIRTRTKGLYQASITKILGIDSRSTGHYCKTLEEKGAISRQAISVSGIRTNMCVHIRFSTKDQVLDVDEQDNQPYNVNSKGQAFSQTFLCESLIELMKDAPGMAILSEDALRALGFDYSRRAVRKWFNRAIEELSGKGYIKKTNVKINNQGKWRRCLNLLKVPEKSAAVEMPTEAVEYPIRIKSIQRNIPILNMLIDSPLEHQCLQVLQAAGVNGVTQKELMFALNTDEHRIVYKIMDKMCEMTGLGLQRFGSMRLLEFEGKLRRYRYYTYPAYKKLHENIDVGLPELPEQDMDESSFYERNLFADVPHTAKEFQKYIIMRKDAKLDLNVYSVTGLAKKTASTGKLGRPRKALLAGGEASSSSAAAPLSLIQEGMNPTNMQPVKKGRPRKAQTDSNGQHAKKRKCAKAVENPVPTESTTGTVATQESTEATAIATDQGANTATEMVIGEAPAVAESSTSTPITTEGTAPVAPATNTMIPIEVPTVVATTEQTTIPSFSTCQDKSAPFQIALAATSDAFIEPNKKRGRPKKVQPESNGELVKKRKYNRAVENPVVPTESTTGTAATQGSTEATAIAIDQGANTATDMVIGEAPAVAESSTSTPITTEGTASVAPTTNTMIPIEAPTVVVTAKQTATPSFSTCQDKSAPFQIALAAAPPKRTLRNRTIFDYFKKQPTDSEVPLAVETIATENEAPTDSDVHLAVETIAPENDSEVPLVAETIVTENEGPTAPIEPSPSTPEESNQTATVPEPPIQVATTSSETPAPVTIIDNEPLAIHGPPSSRFVFKSGPAHKITGTARQVNIYMEVRMRVLLAMLEDKPMWEVGKDLTTVYIKKAMELSGPPKYSICNKTIWRSALTLAKRGDAKTDIIVCPSLSGKRMHRKILIHKDVDMEGDMYKKYVQYLKERRAIQVSTVTTVRKFEDVSMKVERLEERIPRMKEELQELFNSGELREAKLLEQRIDELSRNASRFKPSGQDNGISSWMITAIQFGYVHAKMLRIKMLHMYMFGLLERNEDLEGVDKKERTLDAHAIVNNMSVKLLCQMIGIFNPIDHVIQFVRDPDNAHITYKEMPDNISKELFSDHNKFRPRLRTLLFGLEFLDLVNPCYGSFDDGRSKGQFVNIGSSYYVNRTAAVRERKKLGQPIMREYTLNSLADAALYWSELQYVSTKLDEEIPEEEREPPPLHPIAFEYWRGIYYAGNWSSSSIYTRAQRRILNSYVDKENGTVPLDNTGYLMDISEELGISVISVRAYYAKVQVAIARKAKKTEERKLQRRIYPFRKRTKHVKQRFDARRVINLSSTRAFRPTPRKLHVFKQNQISDIDTEALIDNDNRAAADLRANGTNLFLDDLDDVPVVSSSTQNMRLTRSKRSIWSEQEKDLLIYSYVILLQRSLRSRFYWAALTNQVFPNKHSSQFKNMLYKLLLNPVYVERTESATQLWSIIYSEGLERGDITDPNPREMINFDLLGHLSYLLLRMSDTEAGQSENALPESLNDLHSNFEIFHSAAERNPYYFEEKYHSTDSLTARMNVLYHQSFSARKINDSEYDTPEESIIKENQVDERSRKILKNYALMCLLTPFERYDGYFCYNVLKSFPEDRYEEAIKELKSEGIFIHGKIDCRVPGTKYGLSSRFSNLMAGKLPKNFFEQAKEYNKYLNQQPGKNRFMTDYVSSGMMACMLSLMSDYKLDVTMANKTTQMAKLDTMTFTARRTDRSLTVFELDLENTKPGEVTGYDLQPFKPKIKVLDDNEFDIELTNFLNSQDSHMKHLHQKIINLLQMQEDQGLTLYGLKSELKNEYTDATLMRALHLLESNNPALVCLVGFEAVRYVLVIYTKTWTIHTKEIITQVNNSKLKDRINEFSSHNVDLIDKKEAITANIWTDANGDITDVVLKDCKALVVDYLMRRPGATEASIQRQFGSAFNRKGLREILNNLLKQNVLKQVQIIQPLSLKSRKSIFAKSHAIKCTTNNIIEPSTQSCYWIQSNSYLSIR